MPVARLRRDHTVILRFLYWPDGVFGRRRWRDVVIRWDVTAEIVIYLDTTVNLLVVHRSIETRIHSGSTIRHIRCCEGAGIAIED